MLQDKKERILFVNLSEAQMPTYTERPRDGFIEFGERNKYPDYLLSLFDNSAKHNAIIKGKVNYITGNGWEGSSEQFIKEPNKSETLEDLTRKFATDIEIFGGCYIEVIWGKLSGRIAAIGHIDYAKVRTNKDNTQFWYSQDWSNTAKYRPKVLPAFNPMVPKGTQIFYLREYRPGLNAYALPGYMGALNYIESDIQVSRHVLSNAQTGFSASKLITLPDGEPTDDEKRDTQKRFKDAFTGANGRKFMLSFVNDASRKPIVDDLGASDLTKEDFSRVDAIIQQNIFSGHQITSPSIFGIAEPGKLGTRTEMRDAFEIFKNTYVNDKQRMIESAMNMIVSYAGGVADLKIRPVEPISFEFSEATMTANMSKSEIRERLGLPAVSETDPGSAQGLADAIGSLPQLAATKVLEAMSEEEIRSLIGLAPKLGALPGSTPGAPVQAAEVNDHVKNMSGRQHQQLLRIIRQYGQGKITREVATTLLRTGLGLGDQEIETLLGSEDQQAFSAEDIDAVMQLFASCGTPRAAYTLIQSMPMRFEEQFADITIDQEKDKKILEIIKGDPLIPVKDIAKALRTNAQDINARIQKMIDLNVLEVNPRTQAIKIKEPISKVIDKPAATAFEIKYSYDWKSSVPSSERDTADHPSRPFCAKLMSLDRYWTRREIEDLSVRLGYSVFDRAGGWWTQPDGSRSPSCRHEWKSNILIKKKS